VSSTWVISASPQVCCSKEVVDTGPLRATSVSAVGHDGLPQNILYSDEVQPKMNLQKKMRAALGTTLGTAALLACLGCGSNENLGPIASVRAASSIRDALGGGANATDGAKKSEAKPVGTGWATLRGRFTFAGTPPVMAPYNANKAEDMAACAPGGKAPPQETLVVDSASGGIRNVAIYLRKASRVHESAQPTDDSVLFDQKVCVFLSHVFPVTLGQTVEIKNSDNVGHNTNISGKNRFNQIIPAGESLPFKPQKEEAIPASVSCSIHPWMNAYFLPRANGYVAVTAADGTFEIANLPAGEPLEIQVWHESGTGPGGGLVLSTPEAKALQWSKKGRFTITLEPDSEKEIELAIPAVAFRG